MAIIVSPNKPTTFLVRGINWDYTVDSDPEDLLFPLEDQAIEAATKAVEIFKGIIPRNPQFKTDVPDAELLMPTILETFLMNGRTDKSFFVPSYLALGNGGFYKDADYAFWALAEDYEEHKTDEKLRIELLELFRKHQKGKKKSVTFKPKSKKKKE